MCAVPWRMILNSIIIIIIIIIDVFMFLILPVLAD